MFRIVCYSLHHFLNNKLAPHHGIPPTLVPRMLTSAVMIIWLCVKYYGSVNTRCQLHNKK